VICIQYANACTIIAVRGEPLTVVSAFAIFDNFVGEKLMYPKESYISSHPSQVSENTFTESESYKPNTSTTLEHLVILKFNGVVKQSAEEGCV
jgi:hypothetical protein